MHPRVPRPHPLLTLQTRLQHLRFLMTLHVPSRPSPPLTPSEREAAMLRLAFMGLPALPTSLVQTPPGSASRFADRFGTE